MVLTYAISSTVTLKSHRYYLVVSQDGRIEIHVYSQLYTWKINCCERSLRYAQDMIPKCSYTQQRNTFIKSDAL